MQGQEPVLFAGSIESNILYGLLQDEEAVLQVMSSKFFRVCVYMYMSDLSRVKFRVWRVAG